MANLIDIEEIPGYRLIDAYDITRLVNAINKLYQGSTGVFVSSALTIELDSDASGVIVAPLVSSPVTVYLPPDPVQGDTAFVKDGNGMAGTSPNFITVYPDIAGVLVDGQQSVSTSQNWQSLSFIFNGRQWNIF